MGKKFFSVAEAEKIRHLLQRKVQATRSEQKVIRASIRRLGFYISDFTRRNVWSYPMFSRLA